MGALNVPYSLLSQVFSHTNALAVILYAFMTVTTSPH